MSRKKQTKVKRSPLQKVLICLIGVGLLVFVVMVVSAFWNVFTDNSGDRTAPEDPFDIDGTPEPTPPEDQHIVEELLADLILGIEHYNPLTGEPMDLGLAQRRPVAVVINNVPNALPMNGASQADIIYEYVVEGGLTRMLAIYQDPSQARLIGSIRSARHYTVQLAHSHNAILVAAGRSPQALTEVRSLQIPFLNEVEGPLRDVFYRDRNRIPGRSLESMHSVVTTGSRLMQWLPKYDFRLEYEDSYEHNMFFVENGTPQGGSNASMAVVSFSSGKTTTFSYDAALGMYFVSQNRTDFTDANDGSRPGFANVVVIKTGVRPLRDPSDPSRVDVDTVGSGEGYFISGGRYVEINWTRGDKHLPFYYSRKDGVPLDFGIGKTFICIIPTNMDVEFN